jgi:hypothetical protein
MDDDPAPGDILFNDAVFNIEFHPSAPLIASALITGEVFV